MYEMQKYEHIMERFLRFLLLIPNFAPVYMAPTGCSYSSGFVDCDFSTWTAPMSDSDFSGAVGAITFNDVDGIFPIDGLSGMTGYSGFGSTKQLTFDCGFGTYNSFSVLVDSFGSNLNWVEEISIRDCYNMEWADNALSAFTGVTTLGLTFGNFTSISSTVFLEMTSLTTLNLYASFPTTGVPEGLFSGLTALQTLDINAATIHSLPSGVLDDQKNLQTLKLIGSGLTTLPDGVFLPLLSLSSFTESNNWECTCSLVWFGEWLSDSGYSATCSSPSSLSGYDLSRAVKSLDCTTTSTSTVQYDTYSLDPWFYYGIISGVSFAGLLAIISLFILIIVICQLQKLKSQKSQDISNNHHLNQKQIHAGQRSDILKVESIKSWSPKLSGRVTPTDVTLTTISGNQMKQNNRNIAF